MKKNSRAVCTCHNELGGAEITLRGANILNRHELTSLIEEMKERMQQIAAFAHTEFDLITKGTSLTWEFVEEDEDDEDEDEE